MQSNVFVLVVPDPMDSGDPMYIVAASKAALLREFKVYALEYAKWVVDYSSITEDCPETFFVNNIETFDNISKLVNYWNKHISGARQDAMVHPCILHK